jgi:hypothetical protein
LWPSATEHQFLAAVAPTFQFGDAGRSVRSGGLFCAITRRATLVVRLAVIQSNDTLAYQIVGPNEVTSNAAYLSKEVGADFMRVTQALKGAVQIHAAAVATIDAGCGRTWREVGERVARGASIL